jgi:TolB-like protein
VASEGTERRLAAIMFTDIVGYTALMAESEEKGLRARERHRALVRPLVEQYHGESIEARGDESLSVFPTALDAVNCALAIHAQLQDDPELNLHLGIHLGDLVVQGGEVSGDGVNIASRICSLSEGGGLCVSGEVYRSIRNQPGIEAVPRGEHDLKNVPEPVAVYSVSGSAAPPRVLSQTVPEQARRVVPNLRWAVAALVVIAAGVGWWFYRPVSDVSPIRSIAVLPLENLSGDPEQEYFADGMTEALIGDLAKLRSLSVISRTSVMRYKQSEKSLPEIAQELNVDGIIEGTVIREGSRIRITAQLIDARSDTHLWADRYDRELSSVLALHSDVAREVAEQVRLELTPEERVALTASRPVDPRAYDAYLRGVQLRGPSTLVAAWGPQAIAQFQRAVELDPAFAEGYAALGKARAELGFSTSDRRSRNEFPKAQEAAQRALELDDRLGQAHTVLGMVRLYHDCDFPGAHRAYARALQLSPSNPAVLAEYAWYLLLVERRTEEALAVSERLLSVAPFDMFYRSERFKHFFYARQYERALEEVERIRQLAPSFADIFVGVTYFMLGRLEEAQRAYVAFYERCGAPCDPFREAQERGWVEGGAEGAARAVVEVLIGAEGFYSFAIADLYSRISETEEAFAWLERAYRERDPMMIFLQTRPTFDPLRSDPRFDDLLRRIGFPES